MEIAPGIHRIESDLGVRFMAQYLLVGDERTLLVDTGMSWTPEEAISPYLASIGRSWEDVDEVLISHADFDHFAGNARVQELAPRARFSSHELDRRWIESNETILRENYLWHEPYGFDEPDEEGRAEILRLCGGDAPIHAGLQGGETLRLGEGRRIEILHLPGHTLGHLGVWDPASRAAVIVDAALERGIYDREGNLLIPPRIYDLPGYRATIRRLQELAPELLLTAHYPVMDAAEGQAFLDRALAFCDEVEQAVREEVAGGTTGLWELTKRIDARVGPYPEFMTELGAFVRSALAT